MSMMTDARHKQTSLSCIYVIWYKNPNNKNCDSVTECHSLESLITKHSSLEYTTICDSDNESCTWYQTVTTLIQEHCSSWVDLNRPGLRIALIWTLFLFERPRAVCVNAQNTDKARAHDRLTICGSVQCTSTTFSGLIGKFFDPTGQTYTCTWRWRFGRGLYQWRFAGGGNPTFDLVPNHWIWWPNCVYSLLKTRRITVNQPWLVATINMINSGIRQREWY